MRYDYSVILLFLLFAVFLSLLIFSLSYFLILKKSDIEKISSYECGFDPFEDARSKFDVRFYLVSILFIIFDLEVTFLFPWSVILNRLDTFGFFSMMFFLLVLIVGFAYEWKKGALDWE